jgi:tetratricopeptide (TPR) repeat protein
MLSLEGAGKWLYEEHKGIWNTYSEPATLRRPPRQTAVIHLRGKSCTPQEANDIAVGEMKRGNLQDAVDIFTLILAKAPHPVVFMNRGLAQQGMRQHDRALASFDQAIAFAPAYAGAYNNRGISLHELKRYEEALASYDKAIALEPDDCGAYTNRGMTLHALDRYDDSLASCEKAVALSPGRAALHNNLGNALQEMGRFDDALASYDKATAISPDYAEAHWNAGVVRLLTGDFERGWRQAEWRWKNPALRNERRHVIEPLWLGAEPIEGKTILFRGEQGLGDTIQFCRYVPLAAARGAKVIVEVDPSLKRLLSTLDGVSLCVTRREPRPAFDLQCPMLSLPLAFGTRLDTIPAATPYLRAPAQGRNWEALLGRRDRPRIGLAWSGNPHHVHDRKRSIPLSVFLPLLDVEATLVSLQKDVRSGDEATLKERSEILNLGPSLEDFADMAALMSCLDLIISVDTSVVHLAGALAKPVWVLAPFLPDWRWLLGREDNPWYPTARLFRQTSARNWREVISRVRQAAAKIC